MPPETTSPNPEIIGKVRRLIADIEPIVSGTANYLFSDEELYEYIKDATNLVSIDTQETYYIDSDSLIYPTPTASIKTLISLRAAVFVREQLAEEGYKDGIYIRDGDTVIDTTRGLQQRGMGLTRLTKQYDSILNSYLMGQQVGGTVNTYEYIADATGSV